MRLAVVRATCLPAVNPNGYHWLVDDPMATPVSHDPVLRNRRESQSGLFQHVLVEITGESGAVGFGIGVGGSVTVALIEQLAPYLIGEELDIERLSDRLSRLTAFQFGRGGPSLLAISALDLALWDLVGKIAGQAVARLLGAQEDRALPIYCTGPDVLLVQQQGFPLAKITLRSGHDAQSLAEALDFVAAQREKVGPEFPIALDCWGGLNPALIKQFADRVSELELAWVEEPFVVESSASYALLKSLLPKTRIATGEHLQLLVEFSSLVGTGVETWQPDLRWCGGITGMCKIAALAAAHGVAIMPHSGGVYSLHYAAGNAQCGMLEYSNPSADGATLPPYHGTTFVGEPPIVAGTLRTGDAAGFGLTYAPGFLPFS